MYFNIIGAGPGDDDLHLTRPAALHWWRREKFVFVALNAKSMRGCTNGGRVSKPYHCLVCKKEVYNLKPLDENVRPLPCCMWIIVQ